MFSQRSSGEKAGTVETPSPRFLGPSAMAVKSSLAAAAEQASFCRNLLRNKEKCRP